MDFDKIDWLRLASLVLLCEAIGALGGLFTAPAITTWYAFLVKPAFNPPNWVFFPAWTILFALMGVALYLVWMEALKKKKVGNALLVFGGQFALNVLWSVLFFGMKSPFYGLICIVFLWLAIVWTIVEFYKISKTAAWLLVPYLLWVSFAAMLNYFVWVLNS